MAQTGHTFYSIKQPTNKTNIMEELETLKTRTFEFIAPSGNSYEIREQNGDDDDVISNPSRAKTLHNLSDFISAIVVSNSRTGGRLTPDQAHALPCNDRYAILFNSRIFSVGQTIDFNVNWLPEDGGEKLYEQDLQDFLFDYSSVPTEEILNSKPDAIPFYPVPGQEKDIQVDLTSGKTVLFDLLTGNGETFLINLPDKTKNSELKARNLQLVVMGKPEKVETFKLFSVTDMKEIRARVAEMDPMFNGSTEVENPAKPGQKTFINIIAIPGFFYPGEI